MPDESYAPMQLPQAPPSARTARQGAFDPQHRSQTLLGIAAGFFGGRDLGDSLAQATQTIAAQNADAQRRARPTIGGPDDSFEITTDPETGKRTYTPIEPIQKYVTDKRNTVKPQQALDIWSRYADGIRREPDPAKQEAILADMRANPAHYPGLDVSVLPDRWNPTLGAVAAGAGRSVTQAAAADRADQAAKDRQDYRAGVAADRATRTNAYVTRSQAQTVQGAARVGLAAAAGQRADRGQTRQDLKAGIINGYQYRTDPVTGKVQRRKVQ